MDRINRHPHTLVESLEARRFLSATTSSNDAAEAPLEQAVVADWQKRTIQNLNGNAIETSRDGNIGEYTDLAWFEGILPIDQYTVTVDWGDGTTSPGTLVQIGRSGYFVRGQHEYAQGGEYRVEVHVHASDGLSRAHYLRFIPYAQPLALLHDSPHEIEQDEGALLDYDVFVYPSLGADGDQIRATIDWGDGAVSECRVTELWSAAMSCGAMHRYATPGTYHVTFTATAPLRDGGTTTLTIHRTVELFGQRPPSDLGEHAVLFDTQWRGISDAVTEPAPDEAPVPPPATGFEVSIMESSAFARGPSIASTMFADDREIDEIDDGVASRPA